MIAATDLTSRLLTVGEEEDAEADRPFLLGGGGGWFVRSGRVDVFWVPVREGEPVGARVHLLRVENGQAFFGAGGSHRERPVALLAVGARGTRLVRVPHPEWRRLIADPGLADPLCRLFDGWISLLCGSIVRGVPPTDCVDVEPDAPFPAAARRVRPASRVSWIWHDAGSSLLLGCDGLVVDRGSLTPLSRHAWLQLSPEARLRVEETHALLGRDALWDGLGQLHDLVLDSATQMAEQALWAERERLRQKAAADRRAFGNALASLAETIDVDGGRVTRPRTTSTADSDAGATHDLLFDACQRIGTSLAIEIRPAPRDQAGNRGCDPLNAIAQASRVRTRQVLLRDTWWQRDGGAFLAHRESDHQPVALIPEGPRAYKLFDPADRSERPLTDALAATIAPIAFSFYRPFEEARIGIAGLLRFAIRGCGRDLAIVALVSTAAGILSLFVPITIGVLFNDVIPSADRSTLLQLTIALIALALTSTAFDVARSIALIRIQ